MGPPLFFVWAFRNSRFFGYALLPRYFKKLCCPDGAAENVSAATPGPKLSRRTHTRRQSHPKRSGNAKECRQTRIAVLA